MRPRLCAELYAREKHMKILFGEKCIGCGACAKQCPAVFGFDKEKRRAFVRPDAAPEQYAQDVRDAALICLTGNIKVTDN